MVNICHQRLQNISSACLFKEIFLEELALSRWHLGSRKWDATNAFLSQKCKVGIEIYEVTKLKKGWPLKKWLMFLMFIMLFLLLGGNPKGGKELLLQSQNSLCKVWFASSPNFKNMLLKIEMILNFYSHYKSKASEGCWLPACKITCLRGWHATC